MPAVAQSFSMVPRLPPVPPKGSTAASFHSAKAFYRASNLFCTVPMPPRKALLQLPSTVPQASYSASCGRTVLLYGPILYGCETASSPPKSFLPQCHRPSAMYGSKTAACPPRGFAAASSHSATGRAVLLYGSETAACPPERLCCSFLPQCHCSANCGRTETAPKRLCCSFVPQPSTVPAVAGQSCICSTGSCDSATGLLQCQCQWWPHNPSVRFRDSRLPGHCRLSTVPAVAQSFSMVPRLPPVPPKGSTTASFHSAKSMPPERLCCSFLPQYATGLLQCQLWPHNPFVRFRDSLFPPEKLPPTVPQAFCSVWFQDCRLPPRKALLQLPGLLQCQCQWWPHNPSVRFRDCRLPGHCRLSTVPAVAAQSFSMVPRLPPVPPKGSTAASFHTAKAFYRASCGHSLFCTVVMPPRKALLQLPSTVPQASYSASCGRTVLLYGSETAPHSFNPEHRILIVIKIFLCF